MPTNRRGQSDADLCREMGWEPGQRLIGDEGYGPATIQITAVGERQILARAIHPRPSNESIWTLSCRDWQPVQ